MITKTERAELKSIVRTQMKVLHAELDQREAEMAAQIEIQLRDKYEERDRSRHELRAALDEIVAKANRKAARILREADYDPERIMGFARAIMPEYRIVFDDNDKAQLRRALHAQLEADVEGAKLRLKRQEADLLRDLAVGALESDEARAFLGTIPTVGELVPAARLKELEAQFDAEHGTDSASS